MNASAGRPEAELLLAHRGTAYFLRWLALLSDADYDAPAHPLSARSRRLVIAEIGYDARAYARLSEDLREGGLVLEEGSDLPQYDQAMVRASTQPARALRYLVEHSAVHLSVEWRDLPDDRWNETRADKFGTVMTPADNVRRRMCEVWSGAIDLGNGARLEDLPSEVIGLLRLPEASV